MLIFASGVLAGEGDFGETNVTLISPATGDWNNTGVVDFRYKVGGNLSGTSYTCNLYHNISQAFGIDSLQVNTSVKNDTDSVFRETGIPETNNGYIWNVLCYSTQNSTAERFISNWSIKVDTTAPVISELTPATNSWDTDGIMVFNVNATETNPNQCSLHFNLNYSTNSSGDFVYNNDTQTYVDQLGVDFDLNSVGNESAFDDNNTGDYLWNVSCDDDAGNLVETAATTFYVDKTAPSSTGDLNLTEPANNGKSTDYTFDIHWSNMTTSISENFSYYEVQVDNDSDFSSIEFQENVTTVSQNYTTASGLSGDVDYYLNVTVYDIAGNKLSSLNAAEPYLYGTDSTCHTLYAGWNICSLIRGSDVNATSLCDEVGDTCSYVAKYNSTHEFETFTRGASTNAGLRFGYSASAIPNESAVYFIYVSEDTVFENRTWGGNVSDYNFTLRNASTGWNIVPILNLSGVNLWKLDQSINGNDSFDETFEHQGYNDSTNNISLWMSFYNESAASGNQYLAYRANWSFNNVTFVDYGDAVWIHYNTTTDETYFWDSTGEI